MMNGPCMSRASHARTAKDASTTATSQAHAGTRRNLATTLDLGELSGGLPRHRRLSGHRNVRRRLAHLAENLVGNLVAARSLFACPPRALIVLAAHRFDRGATHSCHASSVVTRSSSGADWIVSEQVASFSRC